MYEPAEVCSVSFQLNANLYQYDMLHHIIYVETYPGLKAP